MIPAIALSTLAASGQMEAQAKPKTEQKAQGGHDHDEVSLGKFKAGDMEIEVSQGHGKVKAGKESHLVIKLPYKDKGATIVRAWLGTEDRTLSTVGKGAYTASHDDYDIHATAPDPLPKGTKWWVEIEKPDGTKVVGSIEPKM
ncbi:MAG: hypothetical protein KF712_16470 [Akkermansiaceae bacterium]|nr:hypothetical protein [Akkermansiaceae bacterium]